MTMNMFVFGMWIMMFPLWLWATTRLRRSIDAFVTFGDFLFCLVFSLIPFVNVAFFFVILGLAGDFDKGSKVHRFFNFKLWS